MIKNGVTPDVITFVDATTQDINEELFIPDVITFVDATTEDINEEVLIAIQSQQRLISLRQSR